MLQSCARCEFRGSSTASPLERTKSMNIFLFDFLRNATVSGVLLGCQKKFRGNQGGPVPSSTRWEASGQLDPAEAFAACAPHAHITHISTQDNGPTCHARPAPSAAGEGGALIVDEVEHKRQAHGHWVPRGENVSDDALLGTRDLACL